uniref:Transcriptional regulator n=1 Tax=Heterorhabditis bacteriophora TaxID=37862 RepID=A0A1I7WIF6_HETBA
MTLWRFIVGCIAILLSRPLYSRSILGNIRIQIFQLI